MTDLNTNIGKIEWHDLSVDDASGVKDFYEQVVGWVSAARKLRIPGRVLGANARQGDVELEALVMDDLNLYGGNKIFLITSRLLPPGKLILHNQRELT